MIMIKDLTVVLEDRPGKGVIHILVDDAAAARNAIEAIGLEVSSERDVLLHDAEDRPGMLGDVARKLANSGVNVDLIYKATQTKLIIGVDDLGKAQAAL
jgi:hypothetical protein